MKNISYFFVLVSMFCVGCLGPTLEKPHATALNESNTPSQGFVPTPVKTTSPSPAKQPIFSWAWLFPGGLLAYGAIDTVRTYGFQRPSWTKSLFNQLKKAIRKTRTHTSGKHRPSLSSQTTVSQANTTTQPRTKNQDPSPTTDEIQARNEAIQAKRRMVSTKAELMVRCVELGQAISTNQLNQAENFLSQNPDLIYCLIDQSDSLLLIAINKNHPDMIRLLLRHGAEPNAPELDGALPLWSALGKNQLQSLETLLNQPSVRWVIEDEWGDTPLHRLAAGNPTGLKMVLERNILDIDAQNQSGQSALHTAIIAHNPESIAVLLSNKANANLPGATKDTPLHLAVMHRNLEAVQLLLNAKADPNLLECSNQPPLTEAKRQKMSWELGKTGEPDYLQVLERLNKIIELLEPVTTIHKH